MFLIKLGIPVAYPWTSSYPTRPIYSQLGVPVGMGSPHTSNRYLTCTPLRRRSTPSLKPVYALQRVAATTRVSREDVPIERLSVTCRPRVSVTVWVTCGAKLSLSHVLGHLLPGLCFDRVCLSVCLSMSVFCRF